MSRSLTPARGWPALGPSVVLLHLAVVPLLYSRHFADTFEAPRLSLLRVSALVLLGALLGSGQRARVRALLREPIPAAATALVVVAALSTLASVSRLTSLRGRYESFAGLETTVGFAVLLLATRLYFPSPRDACPLFVAVWAAASGAAGYALLQRWGHDPLPWAGAAYFAGVQRPFGPLGHPMHLGGFLAAGLPLGLALALQALRARRRIAALVLGATLALALLMLAASNSRAAWLAAAAGIIVTLGVGRSVPWRAVALAGAGAGALVALALALDPEFAYGLVQRVFTVAERAGRVEMWRVAVLLLAERPLLGSGPDTLSLVFPMHRRPEFWLASDWNVSPNRAHDELLHVLATQGLAGGAAALALVAAVVVTAVRARRLEPGDPWRAAVLGGIAAFLVQLATGFVVIASGSLFVALAGCVGRDDRALPAGGVDRLLWPALVLALLASAHSLAGLSADAGTRLAAVLVVALPAVAVVASRPREAMLPAVAWHPSRLEWLPALLVAALAWPVFVAPLAAEIVCRRGLDAEARSLAEAEDLYARAVAWQPQEPAYLVRQGRALVRRADQTRDLGERLTLLERALAVYDRAAAREPLDAFLHAQRGLLLSELAPAGRATAGSAFAAFETALTRDPANAYHLVAASEAARRLGDPARSRALAARAIMLYPAFAPAQLQLGVLDLGAGDLRAAERRLRAAVDGAWYGRERGGRLTAARLLAQTYRGLGQADEAERWSRYVREHSSLAPDGSGR